MEMMFLGPALLVCGTLLIYLASGPSRRRQGVPRRSWDGRASAASPAGDDGRAAKSDETPSPARSAASRGRRGMGRLDEADVLLAEALGELLAVRSEVADLRSRVDALGAQPGAKRRRTSPGRPAGVNA